MARLVRSAADFLQVSVQQQQQQQQRVLLLCRIIKKNLLVLQVPQRR
jgi:hypothetical protein